MEVKMDPKTNSYVKRTQFGVLRGFGRNGMDIRDDNPAPHEFGHMLGLKDKYSKSKEAYGTPINDIWEKNIMANPAGKGMVEKKNLDILLLSLIEKYGYDININRDVPWLNYMKSMFYINETNREK